MSKPKTRISVGFRLSPAAVRVLAVLAKKMGISKTAVVEVAIRRMAAPQEPVETPWGLGTEKGVVRG